MEDETTPFDSELESAKHLEEKVGILMGHIRDLVCQHHIAYGGCSDVSNVLIAAEDGFHDTLSDLVGNAMSRVDAYDEAATYAEKKRDARRDDAL